ACCRPPHRVSIVAENIDALDERGYSAAYAARIRVEQMKPAGPGVVDLRRQEIVLVAQVPLLRLGMFGAVDVEHDDSRWRTRRKPDERTWSTSPEVTYCVRV